MPEPDSTLREENRGRVLGENLEPLGLRRVVGKDDGLLDVPGQVLRDELLAELPYERLGVGRNGM